MRILEKYKDEIVGLCRQYNVRELYVFGSILEDSRFSDASDIDFAVEFDQSEIRGSFDRYMDFKLAMETLLGRCVDVVSLKSARNQVFLRNVHATKEIVYAA